MTPSRAVQPQSDDQDNQMVERIKAPPPVLAAIEELSTFFALVPDERTDARARDARIATGFFGAWTRYEQARSARQTLYVSIGRELAEDKTQLREYIRKTLPPGTPLPGD